MPVSAYIQRLEHKQPTYIVSQHANTKKHRVGLKLPAGHPLQAKTNLQLLDPVLAAIPALIVPRGHLLHALGAVGGHVWKFAQARQSQLTGYDRLFGNITALNHIPQSSASFLLLFFYFLSNYRIQIDANPKLKMSNSYKS